MKSTIARHRKEKGLTQEELAKKIGIPRNTLSYYENGSSGVPAVNMLTRIAAALGTTIEKLYEEEPASTEVQLHG